MEFDEYEYLEKTVEEGDGLDRKKEESSNEKKSERSYRKREGERRDVENGDEDRRSSRSKKSRGDDEENGEGKRRDREKERRRSSREKERERDRIRVRGGSRDRERSSKERDRSDREKSRDREREKDRERRSSSRSRREEKEPEVVERGSRRYKDKKDEPEADPERDQRTVFAYQMPLKATERDVYEFFSKAGKVRDVRLIMDRNSRRSKGVGYIEFYDVMSVPMAIAMSGHMFLGQPVMVKPSEAEKNLAQSNTTTGVVGGTGPAGPVDRKLYVGNLHYNMTELQLRQIFEQFGPIELVQMPYDLVSGQCKGYGFIQFAQFEHAKAAQTSLNGQLEIAGRTIKVSFVSEHIGTHDANPKSADFDDDDGNGLALNAQTRVQLMQKLDRTGVAANIVGPFGVTALNGTAVNQPGMNPGFPTSVLPTTAIPAFVTEPVGQPSQCLLLKNMFDPATETELDFDVEIKDDVGQECSKYGQVNHIYVDMQSAGFVYLRFDSVQAAAAAQRAMHMRWFAQKMISAIFMPPNEYEAKAKA